MSVLITGMEMPVRCEECRFRRRWEKGYYCVCTDLVISGNANSRLDTCPLINLPPHGDLIVSKQHEAQRNNIIALLNDKPRWIPVTERLPREQETVLTWGKHGVILFDWRHNNEWCCFGNVSHWMSLPEPPEEEV